MSERGRLVRSGQPDANGVVDGRSERRVEAITDGFVPCAPVTQRLAFNGLNPRPRLARLRGLRHPDGSPVRPRMRGAPYRNAAA